MSKPLDQLDASKAGVSQAELEDAFLSLATLEENLATEEAALETALVAKRKARTTHMNAGAKVRGLLETRDPAKDDWQRADWIVRNADPDQPPPPLGNQAPRTTAMRLAGNS